MVWKYFLVIKVNCIFISAIERYALSVSVTSKSSSCLITPDPRLRKLQKEKLMEFGWTALPHPPYSPDLAPTDNQKSSTIWTILKQALMLFSNCCRLPSMKLRHSWLNLQPFGWDNLERWRLLLFSGFFNSFINSWYFVDFIIPHPCSNERRFCYLCDFYLTTFRFNFSIFKFIKNMTLVKKKSNFRLTNPI